MPLQFAVFYRYSRTVQEYIASSGALDPRVSTLLLLQLLEGIAHLVRHGVAHRDLKTDNLLLDEPTNDLDLLTLNILEEFLEAFSGCLVLVSHDRYFMDRLVDHLFVFEGNGQLRDFPGNYTDLREEQKAKEAQERADKEAARNAEAKKKAGQSFAAQSKTAKPGAASTDAPRKITYKERRELAQIEQDMEQLEEQKAALIEKMNGGGSHEELHTWGQELQQLEQNLAAKEDRWLELSELAD